MMTPDEMNAEYAQGFTDGERGYGIDATKASSTDYLNGFEDGEHAAWVEDEAAYQADMEEDDGQPSFQEEHDSQMMSIGWGTDEDYGYYGGDEDY